jgi:hypothetical protein
MKKYLIPVLAVSVSVFSAFESKPTLQVFRFNGNSTSWQDRVDPTKYSTHVPLGCSGTPNIQCSLLADQNGTTGRPLIPPTSMLYNALRNLELDQPDFDVDEIGGKP